MRSALRALESSFDGRACVPAVEGIEDARSALDWLSRRQVLPQPVPGSSSGHVLSRFAPTPDPASKLVGVRIVMLPISLADALVRNWSTQGSYERSTHVIALGQDALDIAIHTQQTPGPGSRGLRQEATTLQPARGDRVPIAALMAEAIRRSDVRTARALLRGLPDDDPAKARWSRVLQPPRATRVDVRDRDRTVEYRALAGLRPRYRHQWAAIVGDRAIAAAPTLAELRNQLLEQSRAGERPLIHFFD